MDMLPEGDDDKKAPSDAMLFTTIGKARSKQFVEGLKIYKVDSEGKVWNEVLLNLGESKSLLTFVNKNEACDKESSSHFRRIFIAKSALKQKGHVVMKPCPKGKCADKKDLLQPKDGLKPLSIKLECTNGSTVHHPEIILQPGFMARDNEIQVDSEGRITGQFAQPSGIVYFGTILRKNNLPGTWNGFKDNGSIKVEKCTEYDDSSVETDKDDDSLSDQFQNMKTDEDAAKTNNESSDEENFTRQGDTFMSLGRARPRSFQKNLMVYKIDKNGNAFADHVVINLDKCESILTFWNSDAECQPHLPYPYHFRKIYVAKPRDDSLPSGETRRLAHIILKTCTKAVCIERNRDIAEGRTLHQLKVMLECITGTIMHHPMIYFEPGFLARSDEIQLDDVSNRIIANKTDLLSPSGVVYYATIDRTNALPGYWRKFMRVGKIKILSSVETEINEVLLIDKIQTCFNQLEFKDSLPENVAGAGDLNGFSPAGLHKQLRAEFDIYRVDTNGQRWNEVVLSLHQTHTVIKFSNKDAACRSEKSYHFKNIFVAKDAWNGEPTAYFIFKPCKKDICFKKTRSLERNMSQCYIMLKCRSGQTSYEFAVNCQPGYLAREKDLSVDSDGKISGWGESPSGYVYYATIAPPNYFPGKWVPFVQTGLIEILRCVPESREPSAKRKEYTEFNNFETIGREMAKSFANLKIFKVETHADKFTEVVMDLTKTQVMLKLINLNTKCSDLGNAEGIHFTKMYVVRPPPLAEGEYEPPNYNRNLGIVIFKLCMARGACANTAKDIMEKGSLLKIKMNFINEPQCTTHCSEFYFEVGFMGRENEVTAFDKSGGKLPKSGMISPNGLVCFATIIRKDNLPGTWPGFAEFGKLEIVSCVKVEPSEVGAYGEVGPNGWKIQGQPKIPEEEANIWNAWKALKDDEEFTILEAMDFTDDETQSDGGLNDDCDD